MVRTRVGSEQFPIALKKAGVTQLHKEDQASGTRASHVLIIGIATWSNYDLAILDLVPSASRTRDFLLLVFDTDECLNVDDIHRFIPEADVVKATPAMAEYRDGQVLAFEQGASAIQWLTLFSIRAADEHL